MDRDFRAGLLSSVLAAGLIVALTLLAFMEPRSQSRTEPLTMDFSQARDAAPPAVS